MLDELIVRDHKYVAVVADNFDYSQPEEVIELDGKSAEELYLDARSKPKSGQYLDSIYDSAYDPPILIWSESNNWVLKDLPTLNLRPLIGKHGGPRDAKEADEDARHEEAARKYDHFGAREGDSLPRADVNPDCVCQYCRFYRGEGGVRFIMCEQIWRSLSSEERMEISESCED